MSAEIGQNRLVSLDVFRGMTIAGMVLVNNPGTWSAIYPPLAHAPWHGITPTDYIFPFFLFIVGIAIPIALGKRVREGISRDVYLKIFRRSAVIFLLGLFLAYFPFFYTTSLNVPLELKIFSILILATILFLFLTNKVSLIIYIFFGFVICWMVFYVLFQNFGTSEFMQRPALYFESLQTLRIPGVLQRIAVCYLAASLIYLHTNWKQLAIIGGILLLFYWLLMTIVPVPGCEITTFNDKTCNLAAYLDRLILGENHIWRQAKVFDPEGILSTIPAVVTTISGVLTGIWLKTNRSDLEKAGGIFFGGVVFCALGWCWNFFFPFNKSLWTSSYVVYTSGLALCFLGFCYWLIDIKGYQRWAKPFVIFGVNALALFVGSGLMGRIFGIIKVAGPDGQGISLQKWIFDNIFTPLAAPVNASLMYAVSFILLWLFLMWLLYRRRIYIKV